MVDTTPPLPEGTYILVDLGDLFQQYMNVDKEIRYCPTAVHLEMGPSDVFEMEVGALMASALGIKGMEQQLVREHGDNIMNQIYDLEAYDENQNYVGPREPTQAECDLHEKYAGAVEDLGELLFERIRYLDLHDQKEGCIEVEFHSIIRDRFMLLSAN